MLKRKVFLSEMLEGWWQSNQQAEEQTTCQSKITSFMLPSLEEADVPPIPARQGKSRTVCLRSSSRAGKPKLNSTAVDRPFGNSLVLDGYRRDDGRRHACQKAWTIQEESQMIGGIPPKLHGKVVAHVAGGKTFVRVEKREDGKIGATFEGPFPTELLPLECRQLGSCLVVTWNPDSATRLRENSN